MSKAKNPRERDWRDTFKKFLKEALDDALDKNTPDDVFRVNVAPFGLFPQVLAV